MYAALSYPRHVALFLPIEIVTRDRRTAVKVAPALIYTHVLAAMYPLPSEVVVVIVSKPEEVVLKLPPEPEPEPERRLREPRLVAERWLLKVPQQAVQQQELVQPQEQLEDRDLVVSVEDIPPVNSNILTAKKRKNLFQSFRLNWYDLAPFDDDGLPIASESVPYALYHSEKVSIEFVKNLREASRKVGKVLKSLPPLIKTLDNQTLVDYGFPAESIDVIKANTELPFALRLDWCCGSEMKVIEVNSQTPSFWVECTDGNREVARHFGNSDPVPNSRDALLKSLNQAIEAAAAKLNKSPSECSIVFTSLNNPEDMGTMGWLKSFSHYASQIIPIEFLRIKDGKYLFNGRNNRPIDILFMWYPLEWTIYDKDEEGNTLWPALRDLMLKNRIQIINFASGFTMQPKGLFSFITDLQFNYFDNEMSGIVFDYFPKTTLEPFGPTYFAKPILGRQGEGAYTVIDNERVLESSGQEDWYTNQNYIYQELLEMPTIDLPELGTMHVLWSTWLYLCDGEYVPGGVGMRVSQTAITDDFSYWCPIGV